MDHTVKRRTISTTRSSTAAYSCQNIEIVTTYQNRQTEKVKIRLGEDEGSLQINGKVIREDDSRLSFNDWVETFTGTDLDTLRQYAGVGRY